MGREVGREPSAELCSLYDLFQKQWEDIGGVYAGPGQDWI